ncbi:MAG: substrate-binding domain-containing protein [Brucellaceae bacterium]|nr:substrate-binding domain-containing protein [Brucellaceae bacterium]
MTGYRIACLTKNRTNPAYVGAQVGAARLAEGLGCELRGYVPDRPDNVEDQLGNILDAMAWRPDAMLISPVDATALNDALAGVKDAGVTLVYFVTSTEGLEADAFMTSDNYALARRSPSIWCAIWAEPVRWRSSTELAQSPTSPPRSKAFRDVVAAHPG